MAKPKDQSLLVAALIIGIVLLGIIFVCIYFSIEDSKPVTYHNGIALVHNPAKAQSAICARIRLEYIIMPGIGKSLEGN